MNPNKTRIILLGSTGRIGEQALELIEKYPEHFELVGISGYSNQVLLSEQIQRYHPRYVAVSTSAMAQALQVSFPSLIIFSGEQGLLELVSIPDADLVATAIVGIAALKPTLRALETGKDVAIASKEVLVAAGELVNASCSKYKQKLYPIDSEHAAIDICLKGVAPSQVQRLILTASGGPFLNREDLRHVTIQDALRHPNWVMGKKITIDSATLANKGLEVLEAHWLFHQPLSKIEVLVHPQSIVHGIVELINGAQLAQMGSPDMKMPILYALSRGQITSYSDSPLNLTQKPLEFSAPDMTKFPALRLAYESGRLGHTYPAVFNAANEAAVGLFLDGRIQFLAITELIDKALTNHIATKSPALEDILDADKSARSHVEKHATL